MKSSKMSPTIRNRRLQFKRTALGAACALTLGGLAASGVHAQTATYSLPLPGANHVFTSTYGDKYIENDQTRFGAPVSATTTNIFTGVTFVPAGGVAPATISNNSSTALAIGNLVDPNSIDLLLLQSFGGSAGILSGQVLGQAPATATQANVVFGVMQSGQGAAALAVSGNTLAASTTLNQARSIMSGNVPAGYTSTVTGSVAAGYTIGGITTTTTGSIGLSSQQTALDSSARAGSLAAIADSDVTIDLQQTAGGLASGALTLSGNSMATTFGANAAVNSFNASGAGATTFNGSVALNNAQANVETAGALALATSSLTNTQVSADIRNRDAGRTDLTAALDVSGNTLSAASTGNAAGARTATGGIIAGNELVFGSGLNVAGTGSPVSNSLSNGASTLTANLGADLVLMNGQGNQGTRLESVITNGAVTVAVDNMAAGASVSLNDNALTTAATGNLAGNLIAADGTSFAATVAAGNSQSNDATPILSTITTGAITVGVGTAGIAVTGPITTSGNTIAATAAGSVGSTSVDLKATHLTLAQAAPTFVAADTAGFGAVNAVSAASANNLQGNYGAATNITASVTGAAISVTSIDQTDAKTLVPLSAATVTLQGNAIEAAASGNTAGTSVALTATNGDAQASVGNMQFNGNIITGQVAGSGVVLRSGAVAGSALTLTDSTVAASARANDATNSVSTNVTNLTTGPAAMGAGGLYAASIDGTVARSDASFAIASGQRNEGAVSATVSATNAAAILVGAAGAGNGVTGSTLTANDNSIRASTGGNRVVNTLALGATNLETPANAATRIAGIASLQVNEVTGVANASVTGTATGNTFAGITYQRGLATSNLTASGNDVASISLGNDAGNRINITGGSLVSLAPTAGSGLISSSGSIVQAEIGLVNQQTDIVSGGRMATTSLTTVGISNSGAAIDGVSGSSLSVTGNSITAEARNNTASNAIGLTGMSSLDSSAGLVNQQSSSTAVTADALDGRLRIRIVGNNSNDPAVSDSNLTLSGNQVQALAVGSSAGNSLAVQADNLSGNANLVTSGVLGGGLGGSGDLLADYGVASEQRQEADVTASVSTPVRIVLGTVSGTAGGSNVTGSALTLSGNTIASVAQATSASNDLVLSGSAVTGITGAVASSQTTDGNVTATQRPEIGSDVAAMSIDARTLSGTSVAVSGNSLVTSAGQNEAFNTQRVMGTTVAGRGLSDSTDFVVANGQSAMGSVTASSQPSQLGVLANSFTGGSVAVTGNSASASANANNAVNSLAIVAAGTVQASAGAMNFQGAVSGASISSAMGSVLAPTSVGVAPADTALGTLPVYAATSVTVSDNSLSSRASGNTAVSALAVSGTAIEGGQGNSGWFMGNSSFDTTNFQVVDGSLSASSVLGIVGVTIGNAMGTSFSVVNNTALSAVNGNTAANSQLLDASSALSGSGTVWNMQMSMGSSLSATMDAATVGAAAALTGGFLNTSPVVVTGNSLAARSGGNTVVTELAASATTITGAGLGNSGFSAYNMQDQIGDTAASATVGVIGATAVNAMAGSVSVTDNKVTADANGNRATQKVTLSATSALTSDSAVVNQQSSMAGSMEATVQTTAVGLAGNVNADTPVTVTGNLLAADAGRNVATNALQATAATLSGDSSVPAFMIQSNQDAGNNVTAINTLGLVGVSQAASSGNTSLNVTGNAATSSANANVVNNTLALNAVSALNATAQVSNTQNAMAGAVTATTGGASDLTRATVGVAAVAGVNALNGTPVTVSGNSLTAQGGGNTALNAVVATAGSSIAGSVPAPTYAALNMQSNYASVSTTVQYANIGSFGATMTGGSATVQGNRAVASGYGNSATNSVSLSALPGNQNMASASVMNTQINMSSIASAVNGVAIGVTGTGATGGLLTVNGNAVAAQAIGNSAANVISSR